MKRITASVGILAVVFLSIAAGLAAAQAQQPSAAPAAVPFAGATISEWKGKIHLEIPGQPSTSPARGELLPPGTVVETGGGSMLLRLEDGSQILVRAHTHLLVQQPTPTERGYFQLLLGRIRALINKRTGGAPPFELGTPSAVIAVRGTQFEVIVNKRHQTQVDVFQGQVEVIGKSSGKSVFVGPGSSTHVGMNTPPEAPRPTAALHPDMPGFGESQPWSRGSQGAPNNPGNPGSPNNPNIPSNPRNQSGGKPPIP